MYCMNCGADMGNAQKCPVCGLKVEAAPSQPVTINVNNAPGYIHKKKWTAFWLCLLLGEFGIHRFYVGKVGTGILWLFTCGLFGLGWIIDLIVILCGGFKDTAGQLLL